MKKKIAIAFLAVGALLFCFVVFVNFQNYSLVSFGEKKFITEVVDTSEKMRKGLGQRESLCNFCAMLFDFKKKGVRSFWMKGMKFDLDIIWIANSEVAHIEKNVSYKSLEVMHPDVEADKVLEINSGLCDKYGFKVGDKVKIY